MVSVEISRTSQQPKRLPALCVKTGTPTADVLKLSGSAAPQWTGAMILFGPFAWLFATFMASRRYVLVVPFRSDVFERYRKWRRASRILIVLGLAMALLAVVAGRENAFVLLGVSVVGMAVGLANDWVNAVGVRLSRDGGLVLARVHPDFQRAVLEHNQTGSGAR